LLNVGIKLLDEYQNRKSLFISLADETTSKGAAGNWQVKIAVISNKLITDLNILTTKKI
jgi:hypothetical protein